MKDVQYVTEHAHTKTPSRYLAATFYFVKFCDLRYELRRGQATGNPANNHFEYIKEIVVLLVIVYVFTYFF